MMTTSFQLGPWRVEPERNLLHQPGLEQTLSPKGMAVLVCLARMPGRVVSKDEIAAEVWGEDAVSDETLSATIYQLRRALGDDARSPRFLETIRKGGYRLKVPVDEVVEDSESTPPQVPQARGGPRHVLWIAAALALLLILFLAWFGSGRDGGGLERALEQAKPDVCQAFLKGQYFFQQRSRPGLEKALSYFSEALALDPDFAPARAGVADCYSHAGERPFGLSPEEARGLAFAAAEKALEIDSELPEALAAMGTLLLRFDRDGERAEEYLRRAVKSAPASPALRERQAELLAATGRLPEAAAVLKEVLEEDPTLKSAHEALARVYYLLRRPEAAAAQLELSLELDPLYRPAYLLLGDVYLDLDRPDEAVSCLLQALDLGGVGENDLAAFAEAYLYWDRPGVFRWYLEAAPEGVVEGPYERARHLARLGEVEAALAALEEARAEGSPALLWARSDPALDPLREEKAFGELVRETLVRGGEGLESEEPPGARAP